MANALHDSISHPFPWWSRRDLGIMERWCKLRPPAGRVETPINLVASQAGNR